jgi:hypothetical protein
MKDENRIVGITVGKKEGDNPYNYYYIPER